MSQTAENTPHPSRPLGGSWVRADADAECRRTCRGALVAVPLLGRWTRHDQATHRSEWAVRIHTDNQLLDLLDEIFAGSTRGDRTRGGSSRVLGRAAYPAGVKARGRKVGPQPKAVPSLRSVAPIHGRSVRSRAWPTRYLPNLPWSGWIFLRCGDDESAGQFVVVRGSTLANPRHKTIKPEQECHHGAGGA